MGSIRVLVRLGFRGVMVWADGRAVFWTPGVAGRAVDRAAGQWIEYRPHGGDKTGTRCPRAGDGSDTRVGKAMILIPCGGGLWRPMPL